MSAIISKIVSVFTSIIMSFLALFVPSAPPADDPYARLELPEYYLGECVSTDAEEAVFLYNDAVKKSRKVYFANLEGEQKIKRIGEIEGDGAIGAVLKVAVPVIDKAIEKNNFSVDYVPGRGNLMASDVTTAATYKTDDGKTYVALYLKDQIDGPDGTQYDGGPVSRGIGTLGGVEHALMELGATIKSGRETIRIEYTNAYIICEISSSGYIVGGTWHYDVNVTVGDAKIKISAISANVKNLTAKLEYAIVLRDEPVQV